jgi:hypothetical protein
MKIKNLVKIFSLALLMTFSFNFQSHAASATTIAVAGPGDEKAKNDELAAHIINRVNEIDRMDKSNLSPSEKKELRNELKGLKKQADGLDKRVYLSIGAIIIIILLLILILR